MFLYDDVWWLFMSSRDFYGDFAWFCWLADVTIWCQRALLVWQQRCFATLLLVSIMRVFTFVWVVGRFHPSWTKMIAYGFQWFCGCSWHVVGHSRCLVWIPELGRKDAAFCVHAVKHFWGYHAKRLFEHYGERRKDWDILKSEWNSEKC